MTESILTLIDEADKALSVPASVMGGESFIIPIDLFKRMRNELFRLTVSPPPEEIARLIADLTAPHCLPVICKDAAAALQRLAQEVERLKDRNATWEWAIRGKDKQIGELFNAAKEQGDEIDRLRARIAELEASLKVQAQEVDKLRARLNQTKALDVPAARAAHVAIMEVLDGDMDTRIAALEAERDAIRAKTIEIAEECEQVAQGCEEVSSYNEANAWRSVATRLGALNQEAGERQMTNVCSKCGTLRNEFEGSGKNCPQIEIMLAQKARIAELEVERDAIKAKTIEECMNLFCRTIDMRQAITYEAVVEKIRALSQEAGER